MGPAHPMGASAPDTALFVSMSQLRVDPAYSGELIGSFRNRLGLVDSNPGFHGLEVWQDQRDPGLFAMVARWSSRQAFVDYMRSEDHQRSHARIPTGAARPRAVSLSRFDIVSW